MLGWIRGRKRGPWGQLAATLITWLPLVGFSSTWNRENTAGRVTRSEKHEAEMCFPQPEAA